MPLSGDIIACLTIIRKEVVRFMRIWTQTLLPSAITQSLYFLIFGAFIGSQIAAINGISYMEFLVPGLVMMAVITNAYSNTVSSFFGAKFQRNLEEMLVSPISNSAIIVGFVFGGLLRGILVGAIVLAVSFVFVHPRIDHPTIVALFVIMTALLFSLGGLLNGIFAKKFDDVGIVPTFILTPLTYLGGVFYSIHSLPPVWRAISRFNPIVYMIDGFRYGFYGIADISLWMSFSVLAAMVTIMAVLAWILIDRGIGMRS